MGMLTVENTFEHFAAGSQASLAGLHHGHLPVSGQHTTRLARSQPNHGESKPAQRHRNWRRKFAVLDQNPAQENAQTPGTQIGIYR